MSQIVYSSNSEYFNENWSIGPLIERGNSYRFNGCSERCEGYQFFTIKVGVLPQQLLEALVVFPNCRTQGEHPDPCPFDPGPSVEDIGCLHDSHDSARMSMIRRSDKISIQST